MKRFDHPRTNITYIDEKEIYNEKLEKIKRAQPKCV